MSINERLEETAQNIRNITGATNAEGFEDENNDRLKNAILTIKQQKNGATVSLPINIIDLSKNLRLEIIDQNDNDFIQLAESIKEIGIIHKPVITVNDNSIFPLEGHRRILALKHLGYETVSCEIRILENEELNNLTSLVANTARKNWNIIAVSKSLKLLHKNGYTQEKLGRLLGKDKTTILRLLKIAAWDPEAHELISKYHEKFTQKSILGIASKALLPEEVLEQLKRICGLSENNDDEKKQTYKIEKNLAKFAEFIKAKNYNQEQSKIAKEALMQFGIL